MKVLVTGAGGQLGADMLSALEGHDVVGLPREQLDVADEAAVVEAVTEHRPTLVVNCAAYTQVDRCEDEQDLAWSVNALGPWWLARACARTGATLLHLSTDYVFDGTSTRPYSEFDPIAPQSVYGRSKAAGEQLIRQTLERHYIVRTSWVQGAHGKNFVKTMLRLGRERDELSVVADQTGSPTFTFDLAPALVQLSEGGRFGTYHLTNSGTCTWFEFAQSIFDEAGIDVSVKPTDTASYGAPAPRPANSVLDNRLARLTGITPLPPWRESLALLVKQLEAAGQPSDQKGTSA